MSPRLSFLRRSLRPRKPAVKAKVHADKGSSSATMKSKKEATSSSTAGKEKANSQQLQADSHADQPSIMDSGIGHTIAYRMQDMMYDMDREPAYE